MQESVALSELDLALVNALQIQPRASWTTLGEVLGVDAATVARRWARLEASGTAWITCLPILGGEGRIAYVEIDTTPAARSAVAAALCADPQALTVEHATGARDIIAAVVAPTLGGLSRYLVDRVSALPGVVAVRTHLFTRMYRHGSDWRLRSLSPRQRTRLIEQPAQRRDLRKSADALDRALVVTLGENGRMPLSALAERVGTSAGTARRRLAALFGSGQTVLRCDTAPAATSWPVTAAIWAQVRPDLLAGTGWRLAQLPELRMCAAVACRDNLLMYLRLRDVDELPEVEARIAAAHPELMINDRTVILGQAKLMGRVLDHTGRCVTTVPMDIWSGTPSGGPLSSS